MQVGRRKPLGGRGIGAGSERLGRVVAVGDEQRRVSQSREVNKQKRGGWQCVCRMDPRRPRRHRDVWLIVCIVHLLLCAGHFVGLP